MLTRRFLLLLAIFLAMGSQCQSRQREPYGNVQAMTEEIVPMMNRSAAAWTHGDRDAFMRDYLPGERTTYVTSRGIVRGPERIRERYAPRFAPGALHDSLSFEGIEIDPLAEDVAHVVAWYVLTRGDSLVARGPTSLVMLRTGDGWKIVHDHSS